MGTDTKIFDHEVRLVKIETTLDTVKEDITDNTTLTREILDILKGDNGCGLNTRVALNEQATNRLWKFVGAIAIAMALATVTKVFGG